MAVKLMLRELPKNVCQTNAPHMDNSNSNSNSNSNDINNGYIDVIIEPDYENGCVYIRRESDGFYMSAHDNKQHIYWTEPNDDIWTWEQYTIEYENRLKTSHGTYIMCVESTNDEMWQVNDTDEYYILRLSSEYVKEKVEKEKEEEKEEEKEDEEDEEDEEEKEEKEEEENEEEKEDEETVNKPSAYMLKKTKLAFSEQLLKKNAHLGETEFKHLVNTKWTSMSEVNKGKWFEFVTVSK
jgi:hypothetical protein